jgi:hypothetical protein
MAVFGILIRPICDQAIASNIVNGEEMKANEPLFFNEEERRDYYSGRMLAIDSGITLQGAKVMKLVSRPEYARMILEKVSKDQGSCHSNTAILTGNIEIKGEYLNTLEVVLELPAYLECSHGLPTKEVAEKLKNAKVIVIVEPKE